MASQLVRPFPEFYDSDGTPLDNGYLYIGTEDQNPEDEAHQITVYWDQELTQPAAQPIRTNSGYPARDGTASTLYINADWFSLTVRDKRSSLVFYTRKIESDRLTSMVSAALNGYGTTQEIKDNFDPSGAVTFAVLQGNGYHPEVKYYWDSESTATENDGTVLIPTGHTGSGRLVHNGPSRHVGMFGDVATDFSSDCNAAMLEKEAQGGGYVDVNWVSGVKQIDFDTRLEIPNNVVLRGNRGGGYQSADTKLNYTGSGVAITGKAGYDDTDDTKGIGIENLLIQTDGIAAGQTAVLLESAKNCSMKNVEIRPKGTNAIGLHLKGERAGKSNAGCYYNQFDRVSVRGSTAYQGGQNGQIAVKLSGTEGDGQCNANAFSNLNILQCEKALEIGPSYGNTFFEITVEECSKLGIDFLAGALDNNIYGCYAENIGSASVDLAWMQCANVSECDGNMVHGVTSLANVADAVLYRGNQYRYRNTTYVGLAGNSAVRVRQVGGTGPYADTVDLSPSGPKWVRTRAPVEYTIASGAITPAQSNIIVDTENDVVLDELWTIEQTNSQEGDLLFVRAANSSRTIKLMDSAAGTGNLRMDASTYDLNHSRDIAVFQNIGSGGWALISHKNNEA